MSSWEPIKYLIFTFILTIFFPIRHGQSEASIQPEVTSLQGTIQGITLLTRNNRTISGFLGIPYGKPPIGDLRFANPVPANGWNGTRDGSVEGSACPQAGHQESSENEDCLYLNVYTPQLPENTNSPLLPVMVYIYGGAFIIGSSSVSSYSPAYLLDKDVLLVTLNYRLGPFGFLSTGDEVASGNWGLKDQVLALKWIQDNIRYFGGDPSRVTPFGQSAGGTSVHLLSLSETTNGLFHGYITQSGSALAPWAHRPRVPYSKFAFRLGDYVGCSHNNVSHQLINCLREANVSDIIAAYKNFRVWRMFPIDPWGPTDEPEVPGAFLTESPESLFAARKIRDLPWMCGTVRDEGIGNILEFYQNQKLYKEFLENFDTIVPIMFSYMYVPNSGAPWVKAAKSYYFNNDFTADSRVIIANISKFFTDSNNLWPTYNAIQRHNIVAKNPQYFYSFNYVGTYSYTMGHGDPKIKYGAAHGDDLLYLFPSDPSFSKYDVPIVEGDNKVIDTMVELWTSFATNGTPTTTALNSTAWTPYSSEKFYLRIGNESDVNVKVLKFPFEDQMKFWAGLYESIQTSPLVSSETSSDATS